MAHILYLDDERPLVFLLTHMLESLGHSVAGHTQASDALAAFSREPQAFDLVLTDLALPGTSGVEFARQVLAIRPDVPVALATLHVEPQEAAAARALGVLDIVGKPARIEEATELISGLLAKARNQAAGR